ncbi:universal stress protein [Streptomyces capoamus]|uniref:universal stress protein n=1 Tax=Streptomyces capoamus TaxID=68183 RepID=UPI003C2F707A
MTELPLVVGVDGSEASLTAVDWAVDEAARHGLPLRLVYACLWERYEGGTAPAGGREPFSERALAEQIVASAAARARRRSPDVTTANGIVPQEAVTALLSEGDKAFAVVTGARGRGVLKDLLPGSVGPAVAARARCPVVVVRGDGAGLAGTHRRVLLGAGEPDTAGDAVRFAFREAEARGCVLDVVRAWHRPVYGGAGRPPPGADTAHRHEREAAELLDALLGDASAGRPRVRVDRTTPEGHARKVLVDRSAAADLVVVGVRPRHGRAGHPLGRVAHALLHHALCPVALVPRR